MASADEPWPENSERYRTKKLRKYKAGKTNYRTKQMLSRESLLGEVVVNKDSVAIRYGTGNPPTSGAEGCTEESDKKDQRYREGVLRAPVRAAVL
jgi:hypothetical protein